MGTIIGLSLAFLGGGIQGAFVFPLKYMRNWNWENGWFIFTLLCCFAFPLILAFSTISGLMDVYRSVDTVVVTLVFITGLAWGVGVVLFGLGAKMLGMSLGIAIITGLNAVFGTLFPILFLPSGTLSAKSGILLGASLIVLILGVVLVSVAGKRRETEQATTSISDSGEKKVSFKTGLIVCLVAAIFCPATNFAVFFGQPISNFVIENNLSAPQNVGYAQLLPYFMGGFIVNALYCIYLFRKNNSFKKFFVQGSNQNYARGLSMAILFMVGMVMYTFATTNYLKEIGPIVGWPLFMAATIIISNILGVVSKEWHEVSRKTYLQLYSGIGILILAIVLASISNIY
jgi:L-rhamnose-H+ transport protein